MSSVNINGGDEISDWEAEESSEAERLPGGATRTDLPSTVLHLGTCSLEFLPSLLI